MHITRHPAKPLTWWNSRREMIDMAPPYQRRGRLWSRSDKAYLIDSIINGFDVPKLYMADFQLGDSSLNLARKPYAIIDGKQRLEAIFDFFDGNLVLNGDCVWKDDPRIKIGGLSLRDLKATYSFIAERFETETIDVMSVRTTNVEDVNELFIRLNRSKPLTGAEIRNAMVGYVPDVIRNVSRHPFFSENIKFSVSRAGDHNASAKIVLFEFNGKPSSTKKKDLDLFAQLDLSDESRVSLAGRRCVDTLDLMQEVFLPKDDLLSSAGPVPVYYWLVRSIGASEAPFLREFLVAFEAERNKQRSDQLSGKKSKIADDFARYDALNRSINDLGSHVGRLEILLRCFRIWRNDKTLPT